MLGRVLSRAEQRAMYARLAEKGALRGWRGVRTVYEELRKLHVLKGAPQVEEAARGATRHFESLPLSVQKRAHFLRALPDVQEALDALAIHGDRLQALKAGIEDLRRTIREMPPTAVHLAAKRAQLAEAEALYAVAKAAPAVGKWAAKAHRYLATPRVIGELGAPLSEWLRLAPAIRLGKAEASDAAARLFGREPATGEGSTFFRATGRLRPASIERPIGAFADVATIAAEQKLARHVEKLGRIPAKMMRTVLLGRKLSPVERQAAEHFGVTPDAIRRAAGKFRGVLPPLESAVAKIHRDEQYRRWLNAELIRRYQRKVRALKAAIRDVKDVEGGA